jgi:hypothetical protein
MHGNEPSSTLALLTALKFLNSSYSLAKFIRSKISLLAIPMLNPDGADIMSRRNAMLIDLNRDANALTAPEAQLLFNTVNTFQPHFAFNLHDQELYYGPANSDQPTALALLAPANSPNNQISPAREKAMQITGFIYKTLKQHIAIARYNDTFTPNAFGDKLSSLNIPTILFETGYIINDSDRKKSTLFHAAAIILALLFIAQNNYSDSLLNLYFQIPKNVKYKFFDVIIHNVTILSTKNSFKTDLALCRNRNIPEHFTDYDSQILLYHIGDLSNNHAFWHVHDQNLEIQLEKLKIYSPANFIIKQLLANGLSLPECCKNLNLNS